jgi:hypothetical protein
MIYIKIKFSWFLNYQIEIEKIKVKIDTMTFHSIY